MSDVIQGTDEWKQLRVGLVTGTGFQKILTAGKGTAESLVRSGYRQELVTQRITGKPSEGFFASEDMRHGIEREPAARRMFERRMRKYVSEVPFVKHAWMKVGISPDGLIEDDEGLEIKCPKQDTHARYLQLVDRPPAEYEGQVYGSLWATGRKRWYFASYHPSFPPELQLHVVCVERDEVYIAKLAAAVGTFLAEVSVGEKDMQERMVAIRAAHPEWFPALVNV
jgi:hypothetical protein